MQEKKITKIYLYFDPDSKKSFQKFLIEKDLTLGEAADLLNVSSTYLSLVTVTLKKTSESLYTSCQLSTNDVLTPVLNS